MEESGPGGSRESERVSNGEFEVISPDLQRGIDLNTRSFDVAKRLRDRIGIFEIVSNLNRSGIFNGHTLEVSNLNGHVNPFVPDSKSPTGIKSSVVPIVGVRITNAFEPEKGRLGETGSFFGLIGSQVPVEFPTGEIVNLNILDRVCFGMKQAAASKKEEVGKWAGEARDKATPIGVYVPDHLSSPVEAPHKPMLDMEELVRNYISWQDNIPQRSIDDIRAMIRASIIKMVKGK